MFGDEEFVYMYAYKFKATAFTKYFTHIRYALKKWEIIKRESKNAYCIHLLFLLVLDLFTNFIQNEIRENSLNPMIVY